MEFAPNAAFRPSSPISAASVWGQMHPRGARSHPQYLQMENCAGRCAILSLGGCHRGPAPLVPGSHAGSGPGLSPQFLLTLQELLIKLIVPRAP